MSVCRRTSRIYCDVDDLDGVLNTLARMVKDEPLTNQAENFLKGAYYAIDVIRYHEHIEYPRDFAEILANYYLDEYQEKMEGKNNA